jgi:hypothetical protein
MVAVALMFGLLSVSFLSISLCWIEVERYRVVGAVLAAAQRFNLFQVKL